MCFIVRLCEKYYLDLSVFSSKNGQIITNL